MLWQLHTWNERKYLKRGQTGTNRDTSRKICRDSSRAQYLSCSRSLRIQLRAELGMAASTLHEHAARADLFVGRNIVNNRLCQHVSKAQAYRANIVQYLQRHKISYELCIGDNSVKDGSCERINECTGGPSRGTKLIGHTPNNDVSPCQQEINPKQAILLG